MYTPDAQIVLNSKYINITLFLLLQVHAYTAVAGNMQQMTLLFHSSF